MILSKRVQRSPSRAHISYPTSSELAPCVSSPELLASPPTTPPRGHNKHSLSKPMSWLNRSSSSTWTSNHLAPHAAPKPTRISEPKAGSSLEQFNFHRTGVLGSGATIVRTPQEALSGSTRGLNLKSEDGMKEDIADTEKNESKSPPPRPSSPPLPPLPDIPDTGGRLSGSPASVSVSDWDHVPPRPSSPSPAAHFSASRPTLVAHSRAPSRSIPTPPADTNLIPPQPPFEAILLSPIPDGAIDPSRTIVTLETCTTTYRTSLRSLVSRPSHLSRYITSLLSPVSETASIYSNASDASSAQHSNGFSSFFRDHLASSGCISQSSVGIHIFLDRPSAPYTHVLAYLRSAPSTPEHPEALPRALQLGSMSPSRLESLLELADEARYLGLAELEKLCAHELHRCQRAPLSTISDGMPRGQTTGSVHSFHTVVERCQSRQELRASKGNSGSRRTAKGETREASSGSSFENKDVLRGRQGRSVKYEVGSAPPGWI
ncbi:hypothetical protein OG21DRAFT_1493623 [Imleria badia]|nr:hypothetical protein OG21DRAFT_1493623 [Imleria badia]